MIIRRLSYLSLVALAATSIVPLRAECCTSPLCGALIHRALEHVEQRCACASPSNKKSRKDYLTCYNSQLDLMVGDGTLPRELKAEAYAAATNSTCGSGSGAVTCCKPS